MTMRQTSLGRAIPSEFERLYIKLRRGENAASEHNFYHIHVDSHELLPEETVRVLLDLGLTFDPFDLEFRVYGLNGDPRAPFPHYAPVQHMTFATRSRKKYRELWPLVQEASRVSGAKCYVEGEFIVFDEEIAEQPFNVAEYERVAPQIRAGAPFAFKSALDGATRALPAAISQRRLDPQKNGARDRFRVGEMHLTVRHDTHPKLLELLCNLGFSVPAIPKLVEGDDGRLERNPDGSFKVIHDLPLTLQTMNMADVVRVANLAVNLIDTVGGVSDGSVKIEFAVDFSVLNGVDYHRSVPPVIDRITFRDDFQHLGPDRIGSTPVDLARLTREIRRQAELEKHCDASQLFSEVWRKTLS